MKRTLLKRGNSFLKSTPLKKQISNIKKRTEKASALKKQQKEKRDVYFEHHIKNCERSDENGQLITEPNKSNICHLYDKSRHPSLEDDLDNCIYLTFKQHERFDYLLYSHRFEKLEVEFKNSWDNTCHKLSKLLSLVEENTVFTRKVKKYLDERFKSN